MLKRCYDPKYHNSRPTYIGCTVCDEWLYFSKFKEWFDKNYRYDLEEQGIKLHLDKDLLSKDIKTYSPDTCCFIPSEVNLFMTNKKSTNYSGATGVCLDKNKKKWRARIKEFNTGKNKNLGYFDNIKDAEIAYSIARNNEATKVKKYLKGLGYEDSLISRIR